jgi:hypothetical protein
MRTSIRSAGLIALSVMFALSISAQFSPTIAGSAPKSHSEISSSGHLLWNLEALLKSKFGAQIPAASKYDNFDCSGNHCVPLSKYSPFFYTFTNLGRTAFRVSSKSPEGLNFGASPRPVQIYGKLIYCSNVNTKFLVELSDSISFTLACESPLT